MFNLHLAPVATDKDLLQTELYAIHEQALVEDRHKRARIRWENRIEDQKRELLRQHNA